MRAKGADAGLNITLIDVVRGAISVRSSTHWLPYWFLKPNPVIFRRVGRGFARSLPQLSDPATLTKTRLELSGWGFLNGEQRGCSGSHDRVGCSRASSVARCPRFFYVTAVPTKFNFNVQHGLIQPNSLTAAAMRSPVFGLPVRIVASCP